MEGINLAQLPALTVVKPVDFETIVADIATRAGIENTTASDPAYRVALAAAYRETLLRQDANEQSRGLMLAFAVGSQLDHLGATYYRDADGLAVVRLTDESFSFRPRGYRLPVPMALTSSTPSRPTRMSKTPQSPAPRRSRWL